MDKDNTHQFLIFRLKKESKWQKVGIKLHSVLKHRENQALHLLIVLLNLTLDKDFNLLEVLGPSMLLLQQETLATSNSNRKNQKELQTKRQNDHCFGVAELVPRTIASTRIWINLEHFSIFQKRQLNDPSFYYNIP